MSAWAARRELPSGAARVVEGRQANVGPRCRRSSMADASLSTTPSGTVTSLVAGRRPAGPCRSRRRTRRRPRTGGGIAASGNADLRRHRLWRARRARRRERQPLWAFKMSAPAHSAPTAAGGKVFVVSATNVLHAVNQADGTEAWQYPGHSGDGRRAFRASPAVSGDTVVVPYSSGEVIAFDAETGDAEMGRRGDPLDPHAGRLGPDRRRREPGDLRGRGLRDRRSGRTIAVRARRAASGCGSRISAALDAGRLRQCDLHRRPAGQSCRAGPDERRGVLADRRCRSCGRRSSSRSGPGRRLPAACSGRSRTTAG